MTVLSTINKGILYTSKLCPFANRVEIALYETVWKNKKDKFSETPIDRVEIDLANKPEWYLKDVYPAGKVPALKITDPDKPIQPESDLLTELVLGDFREPLYTQLSPYDRAIALYFGDQAFNMFFPHYYKLLKSHEIAEREQAAKEIQIGAEKLNDLLLKGPNPDGDFFLKQGFSIAEVLSVTVFLRISALGAVRNQKFLPLDKPNLARFQKWFLAATSRQSVKDSFDEALITKTYAEIYP